MFVLQKTKPKEEEVNKEVVVSPQSEIKGLRQDSKAAEVLCSPKILLTGQCKSFLQNTAGNGIYNIGAGTAQCTVELYNC